MMKTLRRGFVIDCQPQLGPFSGCLLYYLASLSSETPDGLVVCSIASIASGSGWNAKTIRKHLDSLFAKDLIQVVIRDGRRLVIQIGPRLLP